MEGSIQKLSCPMVRYYLFALFKERCGVLFYNSLSKVFNENGLAFVNRCIYYVSLVHAKVLVLMDAILESTDHRTF